MTRAETYESLREERARALAEQEAVVRRIGTMRLTVFLLGVGVAWLFSNHRVSSDWLIACVLAFVGLIMLHRRVFEKRERLRRSVEFYEAGLGRIAEEWAGRGVTGERFLDREHPYADDLDVFGKGSLFELLCTARTRGGEAMLASWLLQGASPGEVRARQEAVAELRDNAVLREDLWVIAERQSILDGARISDWGAGECAPAPGWRRGVALVLGALSFAALAYWAYGGSPLWFLGLLVPAQLFALADRPLVARTVEGMDRPREDLLLLARYLERLERESFTSPLLRDLHERLPGAAARIRGLQRLFEYLEARRNHFFVLFGIVMLWSEQFSYAIEAWRARDGKGLAGWVDAVSRVEALCALAGNAFEHPGHTVPTMVEGAPLFEAAALGHPLIPAARCVRNDVALGEPRLLLVSGSNMSGKSSLLRTVGVNAVLALAGASVRAASLRISPLQVGACMRISDSLQEGISHFYAEIRRIRQVVDLASAQTPLLFLLDEILQGTNSHDRRIGAEAIVRTLLERGAVGLVTTHDLALAKIADDMAPRAVNVHFEDQLVEGRMSFDYRLRVGVVQKSNALALMRAVGLEVHA
ncbi:MAG: DNA mismatch repair protein MutS [Armatimonadetes bacterium]|nr:DNA mismatch repair protein MutS [Armatimonadota bacterium]